MKTKFFSATGAHRDAATVAQTSKSAVSRVSKPASRTTSYTLPIWKSAMQQVWKPALRASARLVFVTAVTLAFAPPRAAAQNVVDQIEVVRGALKADRKVVIAEGMNLTDGESNGFWPIYRDYRAEMDRIGDGRVKLVLEYADLYPDVPEDRAKAMLKQYSALEAKAVAVRNKYLKKFGKVLPAAKVLRFAQLENRLDLAVRVQLAAAVPLVPADNKQK